MSACTGDFKITLGFKVMEMYVGETAFLTTNIGENEVEWTSSDPEIVTIDENGQIRLDELEAAGIQEGDTVRMYGLVFDYYK